MIQRGIKRKLRDWRGKLTHRERVLSYVRADPRRRREVKRWERKVRIARRKVRYLERALAATRVPRRLRAWQNAGVLLGVMEHGGNNRGTKVEEIIRANGGVVGEPWCGDLVAFVYRQAGSKAVNRRWASVRAINGLMGGLVRVPKSQAKRGDLVVFTFDHVGLFGWWSDSHGIRTSYARATHCVTREGNTGRSGAVSDSATGGDGVYQKVRAKSLVKSTIRVVR